MSRRDLVPVGLLAIVLFVGSRLSARFLDAPYLLDTLNLYVEAGLLATGMTFVIVCGEIDLSVASTTVLVACVVSKFLGPETNPVVLVAMSVAIGSLLGLVNGALVTIGRVPSFLATLATMATYRGVAQAWLGPFSAKWPVMKGLDRAHLGNSPVPWPPVIWLLVAGAAGLVLHRTVFGRQVAAVGTNAIASRFSGLPVERTQLAVFALSGAMAGLAAVFLGSRLGVVRHDLGRGLELDAITAVVVGGTSILGGQGSMAGTVAALLLVAAAKTAMGVAGVKPEVQVTVVGVLLVLAVLAGNMAGLARRKAPTQA
ncbi:MAG: ABC transporter permease [Armatimonadetes bacterium]|nr:ABC transporter permease [Armatimonadota bacterium]